MGQRAKLSTGAWRWSTLYGCDGVDAIDAMAEARAMAEPETLPWRWREIQHGLHIVRPIPMVALAESLAAFCAE